MILWYVEELYYATIYEKTPFELLQSNSLRPKEIKSNKISMSPFVVFGDKIKIYRGGRIYSVTCPVFVIYPKTEKAWRERNCSSN
jgi:hypothetical protein